MKCKVLCFLLCVLFCFSSLGLSSSAVDDGYYEPVFPLPEDLIDLGFVMDEDGNYVYYGDDDPFDFGTSTLIASEKNYPDFNPATDIPWSTFPQYIKDIIYMDTDDLLAAEGEPFQVPFVSAVVVSSATVQIFVGINVGWGQLSDSSLSFGIWSLPFVSTISSYSCLYRLSWSYVNNSVVSDWIEYKPVAYGNKGNLNRMLNYYWNDASVSDFYCYGANGVQYPTKYVNTSASVYESISVVFNSSNENLSCGFVIANSGFQSGHFLFYQERGYPYCYFEYFVPPSQESINQQLQQEQNDLLEEGNEIQQGIWETVSQIFLRISQLPSNIANAIKGFFTELGDRISGFFEKLVEDIKGLFIPADGFFDTYTSEFQEYFKDRFGLLYELPGAVINIFQQLADYEPATEGYGIDFPEIVMPVLDNGEWYDKVLIEETRYEFDFLDEGPIATLYSMYRSALWLMFIFLLINLIIRKANKVFGGGSG